MLRVGLTGGIGSGKSVVARIFEVLGIPVYYADAANKKLMNEDEELKGKIIQHFGEESYQNGLLNRSHLSAVVFNDPEKLQLLNALTHPVVITHAANWMKAQAGPYVIKEAALIFESNSNKDLDYVIGVSSPEALRIRRVIERDGSNQDAVLKRIQSQMNEDEKMKRCDFVLVNDEQQLLTPQVMKLHETLLKLSKEKESR